MKAQTWRARARVLAPLGAVALTAALLVPAAIANPVTGGKSVFKLDQSTGEGFADMSIGIEPTGKAKVGKRGFVFPISGGDLDQAQTGPLGDVTHRGGLAFFTEGGPGVKFSKFTIELGQKRAKLFAKSQHAEVRFLDLNLGHASISGTADTVKIKHADADLGKEGAEVLSDTFDFPFHKGTHMGEIKIKAKLGG